MSGPFILGLTGSIGMGKSTVAVMFAELGVPVFDADAVVRRLQGPAGAIVAEIEETFPGATGKDGVDREFLGAQVFGNPAALARLEAIVHPRVAQARAEFLEQNGKHPLLVFDIPLLFEKGGSALVDAVAVVSAPGAVQRQRVMARQGMTAGKFADIIALQLPDAEKRARADYLIDTGTSLTQTRSAVATLIRQLIGRASHLPLPPDG